MVIGFVKAMAMTCRDRLSTIHELTQTMIYTLGSEAKQTEYYTLTVTHTTILQTFLVDLCSPAEAFMAEQVKTRAVAWPNLDVVS